MKHLAILIGALLIIAVGCRRSHEYQQVISMHENGQPEVTRTFSVRGSDTLLIKETFFWDNGNPRVDGGFDPSGLKDGIWTAYYENGKKWSEGDFKADEAEGSYRVWHENGQVYYEGMMNKGERTGKWKFYSEDGHLLKEIDY